MGKVSKTSDKTVSKNDEPTKISPTSTQRRPSRASEELLADHLPPMGLVFTVIVCSGFLFVYAFRDVFATGRNIGGNMDRAVLVCSICISLGKAIYLYG